MNSNNSPLVRALDLDHNKFIRASAGAGKTFALSKRYCRIIDDFAGRSISKDSKHWLGVKNILVITFTRKAAAEMATRIYDDLKTLIDGKEIEDLASQGIRLGEHLSGASEEYKLWLNSSFSENYISTIDGFCSRILRENAHLVDIDPNFKIQDEYESQILYDDVLNSFIDRLSTNFDLELKTVLESASIGRIRKYIKHLNTNKIFISGWMDWMEETDEDEIAKIWIEKYTPKFDENRIIMSLLEILNFVNAEVKDVNDRGWVLLQNLKSNMEFLKHTPEGVCRRHYIITEILPLFRTSKGEFFKEKGVPGATGKWKNPEICNEFKDSIRDFIRGVSAILTKEQITGTPGKTDLKAIPVLKALINIYRRFESELESQKEKLNQMSYNDLLYITLRMLKENEGIRKNYSRRFEHIMVDEFQDTNDLRWEIIRTIANENGRLRGKGFFIVGDKKQSIYGFQQADVEVMEEAEKVMIKDEPDTDEVLIDFNTNFRSSDKFITTAINPLFSKLIPDSSQSDIIAPYEVVFDPAEYGSRTGESEAERRRIGDFSEQCLKIRASYTGKDEIETLPPNEYIPALNAALAVKEMLRWADEAKIDETPAIAVLLRKFTKIQYYIKVFNHYSIPFEISGGKGLFEQQETFDLFHLVSVIVNPHDDYALVGLLRSPVFALPDTVIHEIFQNKDTNQSVYEFLVNNKLTNPIKSTIDRWISLSGILPLDRLLRDILAGGYTVFGYFSESLGMQRIANLDRLLNIIHETGMKGMSAVELYEYLKYRLENPEGSSQAELPSSAKVQIMTVHKSKGLQFPIVIIPELNESTRHDTSAIAHGKLDGKVTEVGISINDARGDVLKTGFIDAVKNLAKKKSDAEELRLFYVAVTRAKYRVFLLGDVKYEKNIYQNWWSRFIIDPGFFIDINTLYQMDKDGDEISFSDYDFITRQQLLEKLSSEDKLIVESEHWTEPPEHPPHRNLWEVTPHVIMNSIPSPDGYKYNNTMSNLDDSGLALGAVFHKVLENGWFDIKAFREVLNGYLDKEFENVNRKSLFDRLDSLLEKYVQGERFRIISSVPAELKFPEHEVVGWLENEDMIMQVSGRVDLLYYHDDQWFVLDYKTDSNKDRLEAYKIQIQTYIWMLRQMYGIEAQGQVYFASFGDTIKVEWQDNYFEKIFPEQRHPFNIYYPFCSCRKKMLKSIESAIRDNQDNSIIIINQTKQQALDLYKALMSADERVLNPKIRIFTYQDLFINHEVPGRKISGSVSRMIIARLVAERGKNDAKRGLIDKINKAILESEYSQSELTYFSDIQEDFKKFKQKAQFFTNYDIAYDFMKSCDFSGKTVILNGFFNHKPMDFDVARKIQSSAGKFYFINNFNDDCLENEFNIDSEIWQEKALIPPESGSRKYKICFSVEDEVETAANYIASLENWQDWMDSIVISVSSMERYVPLIKRIFADYGIPTTVAKNEPVIERPVTSLILNLLKIMGEGGNIKCSDLMSIFLNPLMDPELRLYRLNQWLRNSGFEYTYQVEKYFEKPNQKKESDVKFQAEYEKINNIYEKDIKLGENKNAFSASDKIIDFLEKYNIREKIQIDPVGVSALSKIIDLLNQIPKSFKMIGLSGDYADFREEFMEQAAEIEVPTKLQEKGIRVLGTLDTIHLEPEVLLVLGMNEEQFPRKTDENSLMKSREVDNWFIDRAILDRWLQLDSEIIFFAPERDEDGEPIRISTFTDYLTETADLKLAANPPSKRRHFSQYSGVRINHPGKREIIERHNDYLEKEVKSVYQGFIGKSGENELSLSSTGMDSLLRCPMRYWFERTMKLRKTGYDEELTTKLITGTIVHSALEKFGLSGGFEILKENFPAACTMMNEKVKSVFEEYNIDPESNLVNQERYRFIIQGLQEGSQDNLLVELLHWNRKLFHNLKAEYFEKEFGMPANDSEQWDSAELKDDNIVMTLHGKIDKIMLSNDGSVVLATDYKTGNIKIQDNIDLWMSQLPVYYFALKKKFPDKKVMLAYEQIKSLRRNQYGVSLIFGDKHNDTTDAEPMFHLHYEDYTGKNSYPKGRLSVKIDELANYYLYLGKKVLNGEFHIAERELHGKACEYCDFDRICRKDCMVF